MMCEWSFEIGHIITCQSRRQVDPSQLRLSRFRLSASLVPCLLTQLPIYNTSGVQLPASSNLFASYAGYL